MFPGQEPQKRPSGAPVVPGLRLVSRERQETGNDTYPMAYNPRPGPQLLTLHLENRGLPHNDPFVAQPSIQQHSELQAGVAGQVRIRQEMKE